MDLFIEGPDTYAAIKYGDGIRREHFQDFQVLSPERRGGDGLAIF